MSRDIYVDGAWAASAGTERIDVLDTTSEEVLGSVPTGSVADVEQAVAAAVTASRSWADTAPAERARYLREIAAGIDARADDMATLIAQEVGMVKEAALRVQVRLPALFFRSTADLLEDYPFEERVGSSLVVREPIGVVGCITAWNYPVLLVATKAAAALAAGCTVVLKPSEISPLCVYLLTEIVDEVGLPPGVFNLVSGPGPVIGEALARHPDVAMVSFTGSTGAGKRVSQLASEHVKRVALELGGKSAMVILDDADLEGAVTEGVARCYQNSGQTCSALTRMLVPRSKLAEVEAIAAAAAERHVAGNPLDPASLLGPLASAAQRDRVRDYIQLGIDEGAKLLTGGTDAPEGLDAGYFVRPTVFSEVTPKMTIAQEEIFGPVLSIIPFDDDDQAVEIANDTVYGLSGAVWSGSLERAEAVARRLQAGQIDVNGGPFNPLAPFGGYKQSGIGRERGTYGIDEFLEIKSLQLPQDATTVSSPSA